MSEKKGLKYYLIDPFSGQGRTNYNTDFDLVRDRFNPNIHAIWICEYLSAQSLLHVEALSFCHLNTGDFDSELKTLPMLYSLLLAGGFIVQDLYGWQTLEKQYLIDSVLMNLGAIPFMSVTNQLVIMRPS